LSGFNSFRNGTPVKGEARTQDAELFIAKQQRKIIASLNDTALEGGGGFN